MARGMSGSLDRRERWWRFIDSNRQCLGGLQPTGLVRRGELDRVDAGAQGERIAVRSPGPCADPVGQDVDTARGIGRLQGNYDRGPIPTMVAPFSRKYRGGLRRGRVDRDYDRSTPRHVSGGIGGAIAHRMHSVRQRQGRCILGPTPAIEPNLQPREAASPVLRPQGHEDVGDVPVLPARDSAHLEDDEGRSGIDRNGGVPGFGIPRAIDRGIVHPVDAFPGHDEGTRVGRPGPVVEPVRDGDATRRVLRPDRDGDRPEVPSVLTPGTGECHTRRRRYGIHAKRNPGDPLRISSDVGRVRLYDVHPVEDVERRTVGLPDPGVDPVRDRGDAAGRVGGVERDGHLRPEPVAVRGGPGEDCLRGRRNRVDRRRDGLDGLDVAREVDGVEVDRVDAVACDREGGRVVLPRALIHPVDGRCDPAVFVGGHQDERHVGTGEPARESLASRQGGTRPRRLTVRSCGHRGRQRAFPIRVRRGDAVHVGDSVRDVSIHIRTHVAEVGEGRQVVDIWAAVDAVGDGGRAVVRGRIPPEGNGPVPRRRCEVLGGERHRGTGLERPRVVPGISEASAEHDRPRGLHVVVHALEGMGRRRVRGAQDGPRVVREVVGPRDVVAAFRPAEQDGAIESRIVGEPHAESRRRRGRRVALRPGVRLEIVGPRVVVHDSRTRVVAAEQNDSVRGSIVDHPWRTPSRRPDLGGHVRPRVPVDAVGPCLTAVVALGREPAEQDRPVGLRVKRHPLPRTGRRMPGGLKVRPRVGLEIERPRLIGEGTGDAVIAAEEDHPLGPTVIGGAVEPTGGRMDRGSQVGPCVRLEIIGPGPVAPLRTPVVAAEDDHPVGAGVVDHRHVDRGGGSGPRVHVGPIGSAHRGGVSADDGRDPGGDRWPRKEEQECKEYDGRRPAQDRRDGLPPTMGWGSSYLSPWEEAHFSKGFRLSSWRSGRPASRRGNNS